jgi:DNA-binding LacI/PurR family transcriptional regulator/biotin operon repressor
LAEQLRRGKWTGLMPGGDRLAAELGVGRDTVEAALQRLEMDGLLINQGRRRGRLIVESTSGTANRSLRVAILADHKDARKQDYVIELQHKLREAGHIPFMASRTMAELGAQPERLDRLVRSTDTGAWIVLDGSHEVLEWFAGLGVPLFAAFGYPAGLPIAGAGPDKGPAMATATKALIELGHRKIVLLTRKRRRLPKPEPTEQAFLDALVAGGIEPTSYHLPDWEETIDGYHARLESLFRLTRPTALIIDEPPWFVASRHFLARRGLNIPEDISLICNQADSAFSWCKPPISHIRSDTEPVVARILQWAKHLSQGRKDRRQIITPSGFIEGGTIGPAKETA